MFVRYQFHSVCPLRITNNEYENEKKKSKGITERMSKGII